MTYHKSMAISAHAIPQKGCHLLSLRRQKIARQFARKSHRYGIRARRPGHAMDSHGL
jgi:hypothetical protein